MKRSSFTGFDKIKSCLSLHNTPSNCWDERKNQIAGICNFLKIEELVGWKGKHDGTNFILQLV